MFKREKLTSGLVFVLNSSGSESKPWSKTQTMTGSLGIIIVIIIIGTDVFLLARGG